VKRRETPLKELIECAEKLWLYFLEQDKKEQSQIEDTPKDVKEVMELLITLEFRVGSLERRVENLEKEISRIREASK